MPHHSKIFAPDILLSFAYCNIEHIVRSTIITVFKLNTASYNDAVGIERSMPKKPEKIRNSSKKKNTTLSKSLYIKGLQCHKALYLSKYHSDLKDEITAAQEALFQQGHEVGRFAQQLFPGGVEILYEKNNYDAQVEKTQEAIKEGKKIIYEATFCFDGVFVKIDILKKGTKGWEIYEVKSSTEIKDVHLNDTAIQYYVALGSGLKVSKAGLVYINNKYVRVGDIQPDLLFTVEDRTRAIQAQQADIPKKIANIRKALCGDVPDIDIGEYCTKPYDCTFLGHCWKNIPPASVFDLCGSKKKKFALYHSGIVLMADAPMAGLEHRQQFQLKAFLDRSKTINKPELKNFLKSLKYPICFLDFETYSLAIPPFDGVRPYQKIPFQYSIHCINRDGATAKHFEYLTGNGEDPREIIATRLIQEIPENACVVVYNKKFEKEILNNLKEWSPKYANRIDQLIENIRDLMDPFSDKHYYDWRMQGSVSIKKVLPVLIPAMSYEGMQVSNGSEAPLAYFKMSETHDAGEREKIRKDLLEYCKLDTFAMVKILEKLRKMV